MVAILSRLWTGFVGAVAGAAIGLVLAVLLLMSQVSLDVALYGVAACAALGGVLAFCSDKPKGTASGNP